MKIESLTNQKVKQWVKLQTKKGRDASQQFIVEEEHLIIEALKYNIVDTILYIEENPFGFEKAIQVSVSVMKKLSSNVSLVRYMAICHKQELPIKNFQRLLLLDEIQDPGNLGTIIRSAKSFGFDGIYLSNKSVDLYNDKCIRSSQGAFINFPIIRTELLPIMQQLKKAKVQIVGTSLQQAVSLETLVCQPQMAFVIGNEGQGVSAEVLKQCDVIVKIPMKNFESLNAGIAASILMYEYRNI